MKKFLISLLVCVAIFVTETGAYGQTQPCSAAFSCTPNLQLQIPPFGTANWNVPINANFTTLDLLLSGGLPLPALSVTGNMQAPQLTTWVTTTTYGQGNVVFYLGVPYQSLIANNAGNLPSTTPSAWNVVSNLPTDVQLTVPANAVAANTCGAPSSITMPGLTTLMVINYSPTQDLSGVTGWSPSSTRLVIQAFASAANTLQVRVCNPSAASITPSQAVTFVFGAK